MRKLYEGINQVLNRIRVIEQTFSIKPGRRAGESQKTFADVLQEETKQAKVMPDSSGKLTAEVGGIKSMIERAAHKYGVDPKLADAVAKTESNYSINAVSEAGAVGVMQLMPETAASLGVKDPYDPRENIEGGVKYIKQMLTAFDGNVSKAVAAYNAGPQAVKKYNGIPPYSETKNYVKKVLDLYS